MYPKIKEIRVLQEYHLAIRFENNIVKVLDFIDLIKEPRFHPLKDEMLFSSVQIDKGAYGISWNDDIDMSEYELWQLGKELPELESDITI